MDAMDVLEQASGHFIESYGYFALFVLLTLETAMILHFVPSEAIIPVATVTLARTMPQLGLVILVSTAGSTAGSFLLYAFARHGGRSFLERHSLFFGLTSARLARLDATFQRPGGESLVFFFRLVPVLRALVSIPAGLARMNAWKFALYSAAGSAIFNSAMIYTTFAATHNPGFIRKLDYVSTRWPFFLSVAVLVLSAAAYAYCRPHKAVRRIWSGAAIASTIAGFVILAASVLAPAATYRAITYIAVDAGAWVRHNGFSRIEFLVSVAWSLVAIGLAALCVAPIFERVVKRIKARRLKP